MIDSKSQQLTILRKTCRTSSSISNIQTLTINISVSPHERLLATEISLQRNAIREPNDREQSASNALVLEIELLPLLREPNFPRLEIDTATHCVSGPVRFAKILRGARARAEPSIVSVMCPGLAGRSVAFW
jgi:hypothetical protein